MVTARVTRDYCIHGCYKDSLQGFYPGLFSLGDGSQGLIYGRALSGLRFILRLRVLQGEGLILCADYIGFAV